MNNLKERILELMRVKNLTQQQFAEMIKISPASLSSIFNDRTKPTLKHVTAIMASFPTINPSWLLSGTGDMYVEGDDPLANTPYQGSLFDTPLTSPTFEDEEEETPNPLNSPLLNARSANGSTGTGSGTYLGSKIGLPRSSSANGNGKVNGEGKSVPQMVKEVKVVETRLRQITEIRIFYDDQTWETFIPKK